MSRHAAITINRPGDEVQRLWQSADYPAVSFVDAPGDRGTEVHVDIDERAPAGKLGEAVQKLRGGDPRAKAMDHLRRFKQQVETGVIARSDAVPEGELAERKLGQRPAQPLDESETEKAGV